MASPAATMRPHNAIGPGVGENRVNRRRDGRVEPHAAIEQQRKRYGADHQHNQSEQRTDTDPDTDHHPPGTGL